MVSLGTVGPWWRHALYHSSGSRSYFYILLFKPTSTENRKQHTGWGVLMMLRNRPFKMSHFAQWHNAMPKANISIKYFSTLSFTVCDFNIIDNILYKENLEALVSFPIYEKRCFDFHVWFHITSIYLFFLFFSPWWIWAHFCMSILLPSVSFHYSSPLAPSGNSAYIIMLFW